MTKDHSISVPTCDPGPVLSRENRAPVIYPAIKTDFAREMNICVKIMPPHPASGQDGGQPGKCSVFLLLHCPHSAGEMMEI